MQVALNNRPRCAVIPGCSRDPSQAIAVLDRLHRPGFHLRIDDFGTGYSSLSYLKRMPVDERKIDQAFVMGIARDPDDEIIVLDDRARAQHGGRVVIERNR